MKLISGKMIIKNTGLYYVNNFDAGYRRQIKRKKFLYFDEKNKSVTGVRILKRIQSLAIPPAWQEVWICKKHNGHIQATGVDDKKRKQYLYHPEWMSFTSSLKFDHLLDFAAALPTLRLQLHQDLNRQKLSKEKITAAVISLIDKSQIRIGSRSYEAANGSKGAITLTSDEVSVEKFEVTLDFIGKSGVKQNTSFVSSKVAKVINQCQDLDAQYLFSYPTAPGEYSPVSSTDINGYLLDHTQKPITAKDFRTWWANVFLLEALEKAYLESGDINKKQFNDCLKVAAKELGHTPTICRNSYIHPAFTEALNNGTLSHWLSDVSSKNFKPESDFKINEQKFLYWLKKL